MLDQIEMVTHRVGKAKDVSEETAQQECNTLLDSVAQEEEDPTPPGEQPYVQRFETTLTWVAYVAIVAVALFLTWSVGASILKYMAMTR